MPIFGAEAEQIAPQPRVEIGNTQQAQIGRQGIRQAGGEVDAPAPLDQSGRVDRERHVKTREPELLPRRLPGGGVAVIPVHHEHGVAEVRGLARLFEERLERVVEVPDAVVGREAVETVLPERGIVHLREVEPPMIVGNRKGPVISGRLDEGKERFLLLAEHLVGFFEQNDVRDAPAIRLRRIVVAFLEHVQARNVMGEQAPDVAPVRAPPEKIILFVPLEGVHQRMLVHHQRIARSGGGAVHVRNAGDHGEHRSRRGNLRHEEVREQQTLPRDRVEIRRGVERVAEDSGLECGKRLHVNHHQVVLDRGLAGRRDVPGEIELLRVRGFDSEQRSRICVMLAHLVRVIGEVAVFRGVHEEQNGVQRERGYGFTRGKIGFAPAQRVPRPFAVDSQRVQCREHGDRRPLRPLSQR